MSPDFQHNPAVPKSPSLLFYANPEINADILYFGGFAAPNPFIAAFVRGKKYGVLNALEFGRAVKKSGFDRVLPLEPYARKAAAKFPAVTRTAAEVIAILAAELRVNAFTVAADFPALIADRLRSHGLTITVAEGPLLPDRELKSRAEAAALRQGNACSAAGLATAEKILRASKISGRELLYRGSPLTSERLKTAIEIACLTAGGISANTIAAGGDQACDPHERGSGPLRPHELIIIDIFPRITKTGYHGDMTRTFLKGRASDAQIALVDAVRTAQEAALAKVSAGVDGRDVHAACVEVFNQRGYETKHTPKGSIGFFHGTGHGLGLEVHEAPRMNASTPYPLKADSVVTVEPGLYYPGLGGCRIEDVVQVTAKRPRLLSSYHYDWRLR